MKSLLLILLTSFVFSIRNYDVEIKQKSKELKKIDEALRQKEQEAKKYREKEKQLKSKLEEIKKTVSKIGDQIKSVSAEMNVEKETIRRLQNEIQICSQQIDKFKRSISDDLREIYIDYFVIPGLFSETFEKELKFYPVLAKSEHVGRLISTNMYLKRNVDIRQKRYEEIAFLREKLSREKMEKEGMLNEYSRSLKKVASSREALEREIKKMREASKKLMALINEIRRKKAEAAKASERERISKMSGIEINDLPFPVKGEVVQKFGKHKHDVLDTFITYNGIKIKASHGALVVAVESGEVVFAGDFIPYGKTLIIDHGNDFFSIYSGIGEFLVKENSSVVKSQPIARMPLGGSDTLYFEIRVAGLPVDPLLYLK